MFGKKYIYRYYNIMKIGYCINPRSNVNFKGALININALADTHGHLEELNDAFETIKENQRDIFCTEDKGRCNVFTVCGDWFIDGGRKGFETNPNRENGKFQLTMLNEFYKQIKNMAYNTKTIFTAGNHDVDGGVKLLNYIFKKIDSDVIISNLDYDNSPAIQDNINSNKVMPEKIIEVEDNKNPELKHKILFLAIAPVNMYAYQKNLEGISFIDNVDKVSKNITKSDYENTLTVCKKRITKFKEENPKGLVVVCSHTGVEFSENLARESNVDLIFDAHEHKEETRFVNSTPIVSLSQNYKKLVNAKFIINDDGDIKYLQLKDLQLNLKKEKGIFAKLFEKIFKEDIKTKYSISCKDKSIKELVPDGVRFQNNYLSNFVTDSILEELKKIDENIDIFALNSSSIRNPLPVSDELSVTPFDVMDVLAGIRSEEGQVMTTEVSGEELLYLVKDNVLFNKDNPTRNTLIQYSGLIIDKTSLLNAISNGEDEKSLYKYVKIAKTNNPINPLRQYKIANPEKYFNKHKNPRIKSLKSSSKFVGKTVQELFKTHFETSGGKLEAKCDIRVL